MNEYREVRARTTFLELCKTPSLAAEVTVTAAARLGVDAAIIFADLLLPVEPMGLKVEFISGEGPFIENPLANLSVMFLPSLITSIALSGRTIRITLPQGVPGA